MVGSGLIPGRGAGRPHGVLVAIALSLCLFAPALGPLAPARVAASAGASAPPSGAVANFTASINRLVELVAFAGSGLLALVWARVALSWFSNDLAKKVQAKDRARDALIGTLLFVAAITGLFWGLAQWVLSGT